MAWGKSQLMGVNIAGFEFGCLIDGTCPQNTIVPDPPLTTLGGNDGIGQMQHFVKDDGMNVFRLPVSWQYLTNGVIGPLNTKNFANYDKLVQGCLATGAYCVIDIHNFARWNGGIIGQSPTGPTDTQFADLWTQIATKYAGNAFVIFGLMNEPHDLDVPTWAATVQTVVNAIRKAETVSHIILLPGTNFTSAGTFISSGWGKTMSGVVNPDKSTTDLIFDLHKYLDVDNSGDNVECVMDNIADTFSPVADWLRTNQRQALVSETGAGASDSCFTDFCNQNSFINNNSDVYLGYIAWGAGSFNASSIENLTPTKSGTKWTDQQMAIKCVIGVWTGTATVTGTFGITLPTAVVSSSSTASSAKTTSTGTGTSNGSGSGGTQTLGSGTTKTITPSSASNVKIASGLGLCSLILALLLS
jgi:endoglucanase